MDIVQHMLELPEVDINARNKVIVFNNSCTKSECILQDGESILHRVSSMKLPMLKLLVDAGAKTFPNEVSLSSFLTRL